MGGLDFAGGMVVHMTSGYAALVAAVILGNRKNFRPDESNSFSALMVLLGGTLLWFGWIGFNAGSALGANGIAAQAAATTILAAAAAMSAWMLCDWTVHGRPTAIGSAVGAVAGLVAITPAAGYVSLQSALIIGFVTAIVCNYATRVVKQKLRTDDTVDVFACHGVGGTMGAILTAVFASKEVNPLGADGLIHGEYGLFMANLLGSMAVIAYTMIMTYAVFKIVSLFMKVRVSEREELSGLDATQHGEKAFVLR